MSRKPKPAPKGSMGELLRKAREAKGWSQVETVTKAKALMPPKGRKVTQGVYSSYELDKIKFPDRGIISALAQVLELERDDLISRTGWNTRYDQHSGYPKRDSLTPILPIADILLMVDRMDDQQLACVLQRVEARIGRVSPSA